MSNEKLSVSKTHLVSGSLMPGRAEPCAPFVGDDGTPCAQCAAGGDTCCLALPEHRHLAFPLSDKEWARMAPYDHLALPPLPGETPAAPGGTEEAAAMQARAEEVPVLPAKEGRTPPPIKAEKTPARPLPPPVSGTERGRVAEGNSPEFIESLQALFLRVDRERITRIFPPEGTHFRLRTTPGGACVFLGAAGCQLPRDVRPWYCLLFPAWVKEKEIVLFLADSCLISRQAVSPAHGLRLLGLSREQVVSLYEHLRADWGLTSGKR